MKLTMRKYREEADYWRIRAFLREVFLRNERRERSWHVARLDYWRCHVNANAGFFSDIGDVIFLWETPTGQLAAVLNPESPGDVYLQIHPDLGTPELETEMIAFAEDHLAHTGADGRRKITIWANEHARARQELLSSRCYSKGEWPEYARCRWLDAPVPEVPVPDGYTVRAMGSIDELPARSWASWRAFHPDEPDEAYQGWEWALNLLCAPLYRRDLDIVAVAPDGTIAAFSTLWYDDVTRSGYFEPVGTVSEHQRRGLGKAVMSEAMRRLKCMGGVVASVGGFSTAANALYSSVVSPEYELYESWSKTWVS
ncbi:MAG: GNAT family N-acetyltransferase [Anaerolineae bacterium]|nr:GNAT family N-acetyltransferase [Anaerolineae bacterium]